MLKFVFRDRQLHYKSQSGRHQLRSLNRFREFKKEKQSIVLVSHSMDLIRGFCEKTLYLREGEVRAFGPSEEATNQYVGDMKLPMASQPT